MHCIVIQGLDFVVRVVSDFLLVATLFLQSLLAQVKCENFNDKSFCCEARFDILSGQDIFDEATEEVFCNPWALKCHRDHLKKLGLLSGPSSEDQISQDWKMLAT